MREPWPEQVRRTLEACRQSTARDVLSSSAWAQLRAHCAELTVELDALGYRSAAQRVDRDYARLHTQLREATAAGWTPNRLLLADAVEELAGTLAALHRFRGRIEAARAVPAARASGVETAEAAAILAEADIAATPELDHAGEPKPDPYDTRKAVWFGKRIYLGNDSQVSRLFWLLAKPVGAAHSALEIQRAVDGVEVDLNRSPQAAREAEQRMRKAFSKLRAALEEAGLDDHVVIVPGGPREDREYSMVWRYAR